jgi:hypothetical protein
MSTKKEYRQFLDKYFSGQQIKAGLFFSTKNALRFDLQSGDTDSDDYFIEVIKRSIALFNAAFKSEDEIFLVYISYSYKRRKIRFKNYCFKQITDLKKDEIAYSKVSNRYHPGEHYDAAITKLKTERVHYQNIVTPIANTDFPPRQPRFESLSSSKIYFINITTRLILHMYDDRGLDVIASDKKTLHPLYTRFNDWLLDANRSEKDKEFDSIK